MEFIEWLSLYKTRMSLNESYRQLQMLRDGKKLVFMISPGKIGADLWNRAKPAAVSP